LKEKKANQKEEFTWENPRVWQGQYHLRAPAARQEENQLGKEEYREGLTKEKDPKESYCEIKLGLISR